MVPVYNKRFAIKFPNGHKAAAVRVPKGASAYEVMQHLGLNQGPALFITGGASYMTQEDTQRTVRIIREIAAFADAHNTTIIDGGTESGVMQMVGEARRVGKHNFTLIGVAPLGKISYPGYANPDEEAYLEDSHSHFVLVDGEDWGEESHLLVEMASAVSARRSHSVIGVLINGGRITQQDVYLAVAKELPILVLEGSGRFADEVATAFKTGKANQGILRAILAGGDIQLVSTLDGPEAMRSKLEARFKG